MRNLRKLRNIGNFHFARPTKGMSVLMDDGWRGTVHSIDGDLLLCDENGADPLLGGRTIKLNFVKVAGGAVTANWKSAARSNSVRTKTSSRSIVVNLNRARLEREWRDAPAD